MLPHVTDLLHLYFVVQVQTLERLASLRRLHRAERRELWQRDNVLVWASAGGVDRADAATQPAPIRFPAPAPAPAPALSSAVNLVPTPAAVVAQLQWLQQLLPFRPQSQPEGGAAAAQGARSPPDLDGRGCTRRT